MYYLVTKNFIQNFCQIFSKNCWRAAALQPLWMGRPLLFKMVVFHNTAFPCYNTVCF